MWISRRHVKFSLLLVTALVPLQVAHAGNKGQEGRAFWTDDSPSRPDWNAPDAGYSNATSATWATRPAGVGARLNSAPAALASKSRMIARDARPAVQLAQVAIVPPRPASAPTAAPTPIPLLQAGRLNPTGRTVNLVGPLREGLGIIGEVNFTLTADDKLLVGSTSLFDALTPIITPASLAELRAAVGPANLIASEVLATSGYILTYDPGSISVRIVIPAKTRPIQELALANFDRPRVGEYAKAARLSAYVNARSSVDYQWTGTEQGLGELSVFFDSAIRFRDVVFETDGSYSGGADTPFRRESSRFVYDQVEQQRRWTLGDLQPSGRGFVGSSPMAGLGVVKSYSLLEPQRNVQPRGEREFTIERASTIEAFINGRSVRRIRLDPGTYKVRDFPFGQGLNDVKLVIEDDFGQSENIEFSIFFDRSLLSEGLSEYGAFLGILAAGGIDGRSYESSEPVFTGYYRRGVRAGLTMGTSAHIRSDGYALGGEATWSSRLGTLGADLGFSSNDILGTGYAYNLTFQRLFRSESSSGRALSLSLQGRSEDFAVPGSLTADNPFAYQAGIAYSQSLGELQFVSVDVRYSVGRDQEPDGNSAKVSYGYRISNNANFTAEAFSEDVRNVRNSGFRFGFIYRFGATDSITADYDTTSEQARLGYRRSGGSGVGAWNASIDVNNGPDGTGANASLSRTENRLDWALTHSTSFAGPNGAAASQRSALRFSSALAYADGSFAVSRPIFDSFAMVTPHKTLAGRQVLISPRDDNYVAASGLLGAAVASDLSSYSERTVTFNVPNAPAGYDLGAGNTRVYPAYRSGYRIEVGSDYTITVIGRLLDQDGQPLALIAGSAIEAANPTRAPLTVFTNRDGRFGLVGARPGKWLLTMPTTPPQEFEIIIPDSSTSIVRLGDTRGGPAR